MSTSRFSPTVQLAGRLFTDAKYFWTLAALVILGDAVLTQLIIRFISYTEIDWKTYMYHIELYLKGERDYSLITGPTGPLVYPAGHVHVHKFIYALTSSGQDVSTAQQIYSTLYIASLALTCAIYHQAGGVPNWIVLLLPLSKRLHSIFVLRLFNDCWAVVMAQLAVFAYGGALDDLGTTLFSAALSIKMSNFLYLPGILAILVKRRGLATTLRLVFTIIAIQVLLASDFVKAYPLSYLKNAFDLSRVFLYKWTVNWRFVNEETFLGPAFARTLLLGHVTVLVAFGLFRWTRKEGGVLIILRRAVRFPMQPASPYPLSPDEVTTILFTSNLVGILFARSLHYQFYSWYAHQLPFLAWRTRYPVVVKLALLGAIEYAWNVFPSTNFSSALLCASNAMLVVGVWFGYAQGRTAATSS